jgi:membrane protein YdbS with pleckstrin-like domain
MTQKPPILEMTLDGGFVGPPPNAKPPLGTRVLVWAAVIAAIAMSCAVAVFALWLLAVLIPVALVAAVIAYGVFRYQMWRNGGSVPGGTLRWDRRR